MMLEARGVSKSFGAVRALAPVDLAVKPGESLAVTGPSGSGKSTLLGLLAGLDRPTEGRILFEGRDLASWDEDALAAWRRRSVGFVFQSFRLVDALTAAENVALPLELAGETPARALDRARGLLASLGLERRASHFPHQLSGGEQQRAAIARAYAHGPRLILADEPTGSLDRDTGHRVLDALMEAHGRSEAALVLVTHDASAAARMSRTLSLSAA